MVVKILTHSSGEYEVTVETFDAVLLNDQLNQADLNTVVVGDKIFARIDVKLVTPVE